MNNVLDAVVDGIEPFPTMVSVMAQSQTGALLGLDIGTSGVRAGLFDQRGREIDGASVRLDRSSDFSTNFATLDAEALVEHVAETIDSLLAKVNGLPTRIDLIAISCFWHSLIGMDEKDYATTPILGWADSRAAAATHELRSELDETKVHARTGCRFHPSYWPAKLRRLRNEEPEIFQRTKRWLSFADYLSLRFFDETTVSVSMASGTGLMNQHTCQWDEELLEVLGVSLESLPEIATPGREPPKLNSARAVLWPQLSEARLVHAIGDGAANNIGAGCTSTEKVALMIGTSGAMRVCFAGEPPAALPSGLWCYRADRKRILIGGALSDGGGLFDWIRKSLLPGENFETIESELELLSPDAHGLIILPFWGGERSMGWNPDARGMIFGVSLQTRPIEILRAAMEAIAYRFALIAGALEPFAPVASLFASGHALRSSPTWVQILADVIGRPVSVSELSEASLRGAALLALEAAGKIPAIEEFSVPVEMVFEPNMSHHAVYRKAIDRQQGLYQKLYGGN